MNERLIGFGSEATRFMYEYVKKKVSVSTTEVIHEAQDRGIDEDSAYRIIDFLLISGKIYEPKEGVLEFVDY